MWFTTLLHLVGEKECLLGENLDLRVKCREKLFPRFLKQVRLVVERRWIGWWKSRRTASPLTTKKRPWYAAMLQTWLSSAPLISGFSLILLSYKIFDLKIVKCHSLTTLSTPWKHIFRTFAHLPTNSAYKTLRKVCRLISLICCTVFVGSHLMRNIAMMCSYPVRNSPAQWAGAQLPGSQQSDNLSLIFVIYFLYFIFI